MTDIYMHCHLNTSQTISLPELCFFQTFKTSVYPRQSPSLQQSAVFQFEIKSSKMEGLMFRNQGMVTIKFHFCLQEATGKVFQTRLLFPVYFWSTRFFY